MTKIYQVVYGFGFDPDTGCIVDALGEYFVRGENETQIKEALEKIFVEANTQVLDIIIDEVLPLDLTDFIQDVKAAM